MQDLATALRQYMEETKLSQVMAAEQLGISQASVSRILSGDIKRTGPAIRRVQGALRGAIATKDKYSSSGPPRIDLAHKVEEMCQEEGDAELIAQLLDVVSAYRRRARE